MPIEWSIKSRSVRLLVRWGGMSGGKVWAKIDNDSIKAKKKKKNTLIKKDIFANISVM